MIYVLYFTSQGAPKTGLTPTIITLNKVSDGAAVAVMPSAWPTVSEIAGGGYKFTLAFPFNSLSEAFFAVVDGGAALVNAERYKVMQLTVNDGSLDAAVSTRAPEAAGNLAAVKADVEHATYGLNALLTAIGTRMATFTYTAPDSAATVAAAVWNYLTASMTTVNSIGKKLADWVVGTIDTFTGNTKQTGDAFALLGTVRGADNDTLKTLSDQIDLQALETTLTAIKGSGWSTQTLKAISDAVALCGLEATLTAIKGAGWTTENLKAIKELVDDLEGRLTALRAGYLDNLSAGAVALETEVQGHAAAALIAYDPPTRAEAIADKAELSALIAKIRAIVSNRLVVDSTTGAFTIYADDGVTVLVTGTISETGRGVPTWV